MHEMSDYFLRKIKKIFQNVCGIFTQDAKGYVSPNKTLADENYLSPIRINSTQR